MIEDFLLPLELAGKFAVVKLWPGIKTAEDECIARLKIAAAMLHLECVEIYSDGRLLENPDVVITKRDVDFVLHLHYDTPKFYDAFSFVALWNPLAFYHEWGYARCSRNLLSHDDFISCSSQSADDHAGRMVRKTTTHLPPLFKLYHSLDGAVHQPSLGDQKLFYAGINWEAISGGKSRHQEVLKQLDQTGDLRIYGPEVFQGARVWSGYSSYVGEIPFDGISMVHEIAKAGIALVLSSPAHKDAELMSNRLFESVAAGALIICDENNFARKFFGDALLYIDGRCTVEQICSDVQTHLLWARTNPKDALAKAVKAQQIFISHFTLRRNLTDLYTGLPARKRALSENHHPADVKKLSVRVNFLLPEYSPSILKMHIASAAAQEYEATKMVIVVNRSDANEFRAEILAALSKAPNNLTLEEVDFYAIGPTGAIRSRRPIGAVLMDLLTLPRSEDAIIFVAPNEKLFSNHVAVLAGSLARDPARNCAATATIARHSDHPVHAIHEKIDFAFLNSSMPNGYARFAFRVSGVKSDINLALPYLDRKALAVLIGSNPINQEAPSTVVIDTSIDFPSEKWNEGLENELISDFSPAAFNVWTGYTAQLPTVASGKTMNHAVSLAMKMGSPRWLKAQVRALRTFGVAARVAALKRKLGLQT